ncbi:MAG TPA: hypothetical protein VK762_03190, partial [Polyangiaceae bacterium]|nr:hypothetical protein [Polyangiaceae bacterium]
MSSRILSPTLVLLGTLSAAACTSHVDVEASSGATGAGGAGTSAGTAGDPGSTTTAGGVTDAGDTGDAAADAPSLDGTPTRQACTGDFGTALTAAHGRMDGYLVSIIAPGQGQKCNGDSGHVHLQVQIAGAIYDVAVNTDVLYDETDVALPGGAWAEG